MGMVMIECVIHPFKVPVMMQFLGACPGAKGGWRLTWQTMMKELAPQTKDGAYARPTYQFNSGALPQPLKVREATSLVRLWPVLSGLTGAQSVAWLPQCQSNMC